MSAKQGAKLSKLIYALRQLKPIIFKNEYNNNTRSDLTKYLSKN